MGCVQKEKIEIRELPRRPAQLTVFFFSKRSRRGNSRLGCCATGTAILTTCTASDVDLHSWRRHRANGGRGLGAARNPGLGARRPHSELFSTPGLILASDIGQREIDDKK